MTSNRQVTRERRIAGRLPVVMGVASSVVIVGAALAGTSAGVLVALGGLALVAVLVAGGIEEGRAACTPLAPLTETSQQATVDAPKASDLAGTPVGPTVASAHTDAA